MTVVPGREWRARTLSKKEEVIHRMKRIVFYYAAFLLDLRKKGDARLEQEK